VGASPVHAHHDVLSVWIVPAPVAGVWRGQVHLDEEEQELRLTVHQRLSTVTGSFQFLVPTNRAGPLTADLWGDHLRWWAGSMVGIWFDGHAKDDTLEGVLWVPQGK
jgi:hypothetical protein